MSTRDDRRSVRRPSRSIRKYAIGEKTALLAAKLEIVNNELDRTVCQKTRTHPKVIHRLLIGFSSGLSKIVVARKAKILMPENCLHGFSIKSINPRRTSLLRDHRDAGPNNSSTIATIRKQLGYSQKKSAETWLF